MTYTPRTVSKLEPKVLIVTAPLCEGVKLYHTVRPMTAPSQFLSSPASSEATPVSRTTALTPSRTTSGPVWALRGT